MQYILRIISALLFISCTCRAIAQPSALVDITSADFTQIKGFDCRKADFMGLYVGITKQEAINALSGLDKNLSWEYDRFNTVSQDAESLQEMRIYVSVKDSDLKEPAVLYLLWEKGSRGMSSMVFYQPARQWLAGNAALLFSESALKPGATALAFTTGDPVKEKNNIDLTTYTYPEQHFQLMHMPGMMGTGGKVWFKFMK